MSDLPLRLFVRDCTRALSDMVGSVLAAPPVLSGLTAEAVERLKAVALQSLHPVEVANIAALESAEQVAKQAVELARERLRFNEKGAWRSQAGSRWKVRASGDTGRARQSVNQIRMGASAFEARFVATGKRCAARSLPLLIAAQRSHQETRGADGSAVS